MAAFFCKKSALFGKNSTFAQSNSVRAVLEIFWFCFQVTVNENVSFTDYASGIRLPNFSKLTINRKNDNDVKISNMTSSSNFFDVDLFLLSCLATGLSFMSISLLVLEL